MSSSYFDVIAQELLKQQQKMQGLVAENRKLRQELADLREGRGIFVEIQQKRFALTIPTTPATPDAPSITSTQESSTEPATSIVAEISTFSVDNADTNTEPSSSEALPSTRNTAAAPTRKAMTTVQLVEVSAPQPANAKQDSAPVPTPTATQDATPEEDKPAATPFLEEIMLDEFATALTSPMAVWKRSEKKKERKQQSIDEDQKAALRRELMGSFLLE